jgi:hypothetical protein
MATATSHLRLWLAPARWWSAALGALSRILQTGKKHPFDRAYGVDTGGLIYADPPHNQDNAGYYATAPSLFHCAVQRWSATLAGSGYTISDYALVDIGAGKGRVVMMASEYAFREVVGVELNPGLANVARKNLRKFGRKRRSGLPGLQHQETWGTPLAQIIDGDALTMPLPDGPVVLFFFNSFEREMVRMWLDRLIDAAALRSAPIDLIYVHPEHRELFLQTPGMELLADEVMAFSEEDAAADVFGVSMDRYAVYRLS